MVQCQNCGQVNNYGSNFCRFCGTRMVMTQQQPPPVNQNAAPYEYNPPRPYVWKTDEFQLPENGERKSRQINQVQPLANLNLQNQPAPPPALPTFRQPAAAAPIAHYNYRCPRCGTQNFPYLSRKISTAGWIVFAVLLVTFFPLFWIGFLIKEDVKICSVCNTRVG